MKSLGIAICLLLSCSLVFGQTRQDATASEFEEEYQSDTSVYENENLEQSDIGEDETYDQETETMEETQTETQSEMDMESESEVDEAAEEAIEEHEEEMHQTETETETDLNQMETETESDVNQMETETESDVNQMETETESDVNQMETETESDVNQMETEPEMDQSSESADMDRDEKEQVSVQVEADEKLDNDFSEYQSYNFVSHVDEELDPGFYFLNDLAFKANVRETVKGELEGLGYERDENDPDLLISFRVFDEPLTLKGFTDPGYGPGYWGADTQVREWEDTTSYDVEAGTLLLSILDAEQGEIVWQGFASGLIEQDAFSKDDQKIAEAVELLFEEYGHRAKDLDDQVVK